MEEEEILRPQLQNHTTEMKQSHRVVNPLRSKTERTSLPVLRQKPSNRINIRGGEARVEGGGGGGGDEGMGGGGGGGGSTRPRFGAIIATTSKRRI